MSETLKAFAQLVKFRLTITVVATSAFGYLLGLKYTYLDEWQHYFHWMNFLGVFFGGMLIVFASNGLNQVIEKENDSRMSRTSKRPMVEDRLTIQQARIFCFVSGVAGIVWLYFAANALSALLGFLSFAIYVFVYTPMKQISPLSVMVGAFPGALPPLIGYTAVTNGLDFPGLILFLVQFFWQFPHFWAIAWILHEDYQKAGYWLLPSAGGRDKNSAYQVLIYTVILIAVSLMPIYHAYYNLATHNALYQLAVVLPLGLWFLYKAFRLFKSLEVADARKLLYASFLYTPVVFLAYILI